VSSSVVNVQDGAAAFKRLVSATLLADSGESAEANSPSRLDIGLIIKDVGELYMESMHLAMSDLLLENMLRLASQRIVESEDSKLPLVIFRMAEHLGVVEATPEYLGLIAADPLAVDSIFEMLNEPFSRRILGGFEKLMQLIDAFHLQNVWSEPPLLAGKELREVWFKRYNLFSLTDNY
jgi:hypothetical protein